MNDADAIRAAEQAERAIDAVRHAKRADGAIDAAAEAEPNAAVDRVVARGPGGTFAVAGLATAVVIALYVAFYFLAYLPRGVVQ